MRLQYVAMISLVIAGLCFFASDGPAAETNALEPVRSSGETDSEQDQRMAWFNEARFGMFVHWGPVALQGTEIGWSRGREVPNAEYDQLYKTFNPKEFDADAWALTAKQAGMKYLVLTAKHHDGFCLWPSKYTDYHIGNTPFKRDVVKELSDACKKQGIRFCTYYSVCDWYHPDYPLGSPGGKTKKQNHDMPRYHKYLQNQTKELIDNYGPLGLIWFDGEWEKPWTRAYGNQLYDDLLKIQPSLIVNNRVSKGRLGMTGTTKQSDLNAGDYDTPEQRVGGFNRDRPWETCMTIGHQWAWKPNDKMKSKKECIQTLLRTVGGDGNLLFNVGPMPDGRIELRQVERLKEMGDWLAKHGDGVYGTRGGPFKPGKWGASTCKGNKIYLFVMNWPPEGPLELPAAGITSLGAKSLSGSTIYVQLAPDTFTIDVPSSDRDEIATVIELTVDGEAFDIKPVDVAHHSLSLAYGKKATASNVFMQVDFLGAGMVVDDNPETRWATDTGTSEAWLEVDLGAPATIGRVLLDEPREYKRVQAFDLQYHDGGSWKTFHTGTTIGPEHQIKVKPITTRRIRLNITKASDGPTINEFQLFSPANGAP